MYPLLFSQGTAVNFPTPYFTWIHVDLSAGPSSTCPSSTHWARWPWRSVPSPTSPTPTRTESPTTWPFTCRPTSNCFCCCCFVVSCFYRFTQPHVLPWRPALCPWSASSSSLWAPAGSNPAWLPLAGISSMRLRFDHFLSETKCCCLKFQRWSCFAALLFVSCKKKPLFKFHFNFNLNELNNWICGYIIYLIGR